jgi:hypothetical protein
VGPRAGLNVCEKFRPHRDSIPGPSSPYPVDIPTELPGLRSMLDVVHFLRYVSDTCFGSWLYSFLQVVNILRKFCNFVNSNVNGRGCEDHLQ